MSQRFTIKDEMRRIDRGLIKDAQKEWGTFVTWWRFDPDSTVSDDIYDVGEGRRWHPPIRMPVLWVVRTEGSDTFRAEGQYTVDQIQLAVAKTTLRDRLGWQDVPDNVDAYLHHRIEYDKKLFTLVSLQVTGQLKDRDVTVGIDARVVREEQQFFDPDFNPPVTP